MKRWRCVGRIGIPTADRRMILDPEIGPQSVPVRLPAGDGHVGAETVAKAEVRIINDRIEALLPWRLRNVTPAFVGGRSEVLHGPISFILRGATLRALGPGPSAWSPEVLR